MYCIDYKEVLFLKRIIVGQKKDEFIRDGQFVFNVCVKWMNEKLSCKNVTFKNDCFYNDEKIEAFLFEFVMNYLWCDKYHEFLNFLVKNGVYQVNDGDLVGEIKDFPIEVVQKMLENQYRQTGMCDIKDIQGDVDCFCWDDTDEGSKFWYEVIVGRDFKLFFEKYPKTESCDEVNIGTEDSADSSVIRIPFPKGYSFENVDNDKGVVVFRKI